MELRKVHNNYFATMKHNIASTQYFNPLLQKKKKIDFKIRKGHQKNFL